MERIEEKIKYGMINFGEIREVAIGSFSYIYRDIVDIKQNYIRLGFHLHEMKSREYYKDLGYSDFYECVEKNFALDKSAVSRCINLWWNFSECQGHSRKMWLDEKYASYNYSQLCEMLSMNEQERKKVSPDMPVSKIRELKKKFSCSPNCCDVATSRGKRYRR